MYSWEIVCVETDDDSDFDDCRAITQLGYKAPTLKQLSADVVGARLKQGHSDFHIEVDGRRVPLQSAKDPEVNFYARTLDEDRPDDPLLELTSCSQYELEDHLEGIS